MELTFELLQVIAKFLFDSIRQFTDLLAEVFLRDKLSLAVEE